ncbi:MAG: PKD domain-containing protein [Saprospiraceae bacterium]
MKNLTTHFPKASKNHFSAHSPFIVPRSSFILAVLLVFNTLQMFGQTFQTAIGYPVPTDERGASGLITNAGNYLILGGNTQHPSGLFNPAGDMQLVRLDPLGNLLFPSKILGQDVGETATWIEKATDCAGAQGYIIAGNQYNGGGNNMLLTLTDAVGTPQWVRRIGTFSDDEKSACVKQDGAGNIILVGTKTDPISGMSLIHAVKTDCAGNLLWEWTYRVNGIPTVTSVTAFATLQSACPNLPNEYFVTGKVSSAAGGNEEVFILSLQVSTGNVSWMKTYDVAPNADDVGACIQGNCSGLPPAIGRLWVSGYSLEPGGSSPRKVLMLQTDISGNLIWANNYDIQNSDQELSTHFQFAADNKLVLTGKAEDPGVSDPPEIGNCMLMRIADNGSSLDWTRVFQMGFASQGNRVEPNAGDEYFITGHTYEIIQPHIFDYNILAIKTNKIGQTDSDCHHSPQTLIIPRQPVTTVVQPFAIIPQDFFPSSLVTVLYNDQQTFCQNPSPIDPCDTLALNANFTYSVSGNTVTFTDLSTVGSGSIFGWNWDFGDANTSTSQNPVHTYAGSGVYVVCLIVTGGVNGAICRDTICKDIIIQHTPTDPCDTLALNANFTYSVSGNTVTFTDLSTIGSGSIFGWNWDFGDANTSTSQNPVHTYAGPGVYIVCLIVTGGDATALCRDTICKDVVIVQSGCECDSTFFAAVAAGFTTSGTNPITFTPVALTPCDNVQWLWGDASPNGASVGNASITHTFPGPGTYYVCMLVTRISVNGQTCTVESCKQIVVPSFCDFSENYSAPVGWTQVGSLVSIAGGVVQYQNGAPDGEQRRVHKNLGFTLNTSDIWQADLDVTPQMIGSSAPSTGHAVLALTSTTDEPHSACTNIPCTGYPTSVQDAINCNFSSPAGSTNTFFHLIAFDGPTQYTSTNIPATTLNITYYIRVARTSPTSVTLSVFSDAARTLHISGSPISMAIPATITGLGTVQHANVARGFQTRQLWGFLDNLCIRRMGTSATSDLTAKANASIFPNPTSGDFTLEFGEALESETTLTVLDLTGRTILQATVPQGGSSQTLSLGHCPSGIYVVRAMSGGRPIWTGKVVKE